MANIYEHQPAGRRALLSQNSRALLQEPSVTQQGDTSTLSDTRLPLNGVVKIKDMGGLLDKQSWHSQRLHTSSTNRWHRKHVVIPARKVQKQTQKLFCLDQDDEYVRKLKDRYQEHQQLSKSTLVQSPKPVLNLQQT